MTRFNDKLGRSIAAIALSIGATVMVGCGVEPGAGGTASDLLLAGPLESVEHASWADAAAGCEGYLEDDVHFAVADADDGLVAAVDEDGSIVCIDTVEAVGEELEETGREDEADALASAFTATTTAAQSKQDGTRLQAAGTRGADPQPEPSIGYEGFNYGADPQPEPSMN